MKRTVFHLTLSVVLLCFALALGSFGYYELKTSEAIHHFLALDFDSAGQVYADLTTKIGRFDQLTASRFSKTPSRFFEKWGFNLTFKQVETQYWQKKYSSILNNDSKDADIEFIKANATYRNIGSERNKDKVLNGINQAIAGYVSAMKSNPGNLDATFNYEYLTQIRSDVVRNIKQLPLNGQPGKESKGKSIEDARTLHGQEGRQAKESGGESTIKVHVPLRNDEVMPGNKQSIGNAPRKKG